jgi:putative transposase
MFSLLTFLFSTILSLFKSKKDLIVQIILQRKEIEILLRKNQKKRLKFHHSDRIILSILNRISNIKESISIVKPETVLKWQRQLIKHFWTFISENHAGRPPVDKEIKQLILSMKNDNLYWGYKKIQGELLKLGVSLDQKTIRNILAVYRRQGKINQSLTWRQFLRQQAHSIFAMDFFTIDTITNQRFYVYFIICHKTRQVVHYSVTKNPCREFVRQQLIEFEEKFKQLIYMIYDNAPQFKLDYASFGIEGVRTSIQAPNMNAIAERFVGSVRREALDYFILFHENQIKNILKEYVDYYNSLRPHQGIAQKIPNGYKPKSRGRVLKLPILGGLCNHYLRWGT